MTTTNVLITRMSDEELVRHFVRCCEEVVLGEGEGWDQTIAVRRRAEAANEIRRRMTAAALPAPNGDPK